MGTAIKHPVPDRVKLSFVIFDTWALWRSDWVSECWDVKITTNDCLTRSDTGCFIAVPIWQQWVSKEWPIIDTHDTCKNCSHKSFMCGALKWGKFRPSKDVTFSTCWNMQLQGWFIEEVLCHGALPLGCVGLTMHVHCSVMEQREKVLEALVF